MADQKKKKKPTKINVVKVLRKDIILEVRSLRMPLGGSVYFRSYLEVT